MIGQLARGLPRSGLGLAVALACLLTALPALAQSGFGAPVPGQRIYDRTGLLTPAEVAELERHAVAVERAGAPVVVYLQARSASQDETQRDARALMDAWSVESRPGARDGVVIFLSLKPGDLRHGEVALYAGAAHFAGGNLPPAELARIFRDVMRPKLADGQTAAGIAAGLDAVATSLVSGPPPPDPAQQAVADLVRVPLNVLAVLFSLGLAFLIARALQSRPNGGPAGPSVSVPPGDLPPAVAGALLKGRTGNEQAQATILDLARRGALAIEPAGAKTVQIRLLRPDLVRSPYEESVWRSLAELADAAGVVASNNLPKAPNRWGLSNEVLRRELEQRGWFDAGAGQRRRPLYVAGAAALLFAVLLGILSIAGNEPWGLLGAGLLVLDGIVALCVGYALPSTTVEGVRLAAAWRGYRTGLQSAGREPAIYLNLDDALPYAVALGVASALDKRLKAASAEGYAPAWFSRSFATGGGGEAGFYPYWTAFNGSTAPSSSGGSTSGGASAGGGGAGGSF